MNLIAPRLSRIRHSPSTAAAQRVRELRAEGREIVDLTLGEPDFETPANVKQAAIAAMARNETRYTNVSGIRELKEAVRLKFLRENGLRFAHDQIIAATGSKQIVFNAMMATLDAGAEVIVPAPYWVSYLDMVLVSGGTPVVVPTAASSGFKMSPAQLDAAITPRTRWLILNSPCNPSGAMYTRSELAALAEVLLGHPHVWILSDDVYEHLVYDGAGFSTIAEVEPALQARTLTVNGVSKAYAMTGWRIGYAGGPAELVANMGKLQSHCTSSPCAISQWAAVEALTGPQEFLADRASTFARRRDLVLGLLGSVPALDCFKPLGAIYVFTDCTGMVGRRTPAGRSLESDIDVVLYLLDAGVAVIPGEAYGLSPYFRLSIAASTETLIAGCRRIVDAIAALS